MNKLVGLAISTIAFAAPVVAHATPVTWSFYETAITSCNSPLPFGCVLPPQPFVFMTLTLPGPTSTGTAIWQGSPSLPVYTGDSFALSLPFKSNRFTNPLTPAFAGAASNDGGLACPDNNVGSSALCDFNISWAENAGVLTAISINIDAIDDNIGGFAGHGPFGLTGGPLATDFTLGGCGFTQCIIAGFWQSDLTAVPEPMSAVLLIIGFLGACLALRSRRSA
jgi:hypothetical protein